MRVGLVEMEKNLNVQELVYQIVIALVDSPNEVQVTSTVSEQGTDLRVTVAPTDVGKVIGKSGRTARSLRLILSAIGMTSKTKYSLDIVSRHRPSEG
jgi:predicted RNA-binding protein YlqC (UPF0109 family)